MNVPYPWPRPCLSIWEEVQPHRSERDDTHHIPLPAGAYGEGGAAAGSSAVGGGIMAISGMRFTPPATIVEEFARTIAAA
jgi:hypothetical protein